MGDWYIESVDNIERCAQDLGEAVERQVAALREGRVNRIAGMGLVDIVRQFNSRGGRELRLNSTAAFRAFEKAMTGYRVAVIRALVDKEQMSFSAVAELTGVSRQMIARLYRSEP